MNELPGDLARTPETRLLLELLAAEQCGPLPACPVGLDGPRFLALVAHHRVAALFPRALREEGLFPPELDDALRRMREWHYANALRHAAELARLATQLRVAGIEALAIKGPAVAALFHTEPTRRACRDLDWLVRPADRAAALALLRGLGYRLVIEGPNAVELEHAERRVATELHDRLTNDDRQLPVALLRAFETAVQVEVAGTAVATMAPEQAVVFAACHGTKHLWRRLVWLVDVAEAVRCGRVDWALALQLARTAGVERQLALALALAEDLLGVTLPAPLAQERALFAAVRRRGRPVYRIVLSPPTPSDVQAMQAFGRVRFAAWDLANHRRWPARWATLLGHLRPTANDLGLAALPPRLAFLYPALRVLRVLGLVGRDRGPWPPAGDG